MSENQEPPAAEAPIEFKKRSAAEFPNAPKPSNPPTTRDDCIAFGGHDPSKSYYPNARINLKTGTIDKGPRVCGVCGEVDI